MVKEENLQKILTKQKSGRGKCCLSRKSQKTPLNHDVLWNGPWKTKRVFERGPSGNDPFSRTTAPSRHIDQSESWTGMVLIIQNMKLCALLQKSYLDPSIISHCFGLGIFVAQFAVIIIIILLIILVVLIINIFFFFNYYFFIIIFMIICSAVVWQHRNMFVLRRSNSTLRR